MGTLDNGCEVLIPKSCPVDHSGNVCEECHTPCTVRTSFVDFEISCLGPLDFKIICYSNVLILSVLDEVF